MEQPPPTASGRITGPMATQATATALTAIQATAAVTATFRATAMALTVTAIRVTATAATTPPTIPNHPARRNTPPPWPSAGGLQNPPHLAFCNLVTKPAE